MTLADRIGLYALVVGVAGLIWSVWAHRDATNASTDALSASTALRLQHALLDDTLVLLDPELTEDGQVTAWLALRARFDIVMSHRGRVLSDEDFSLITMQLCTMLDPQSIKSHFSELEDQCEN